MEIPATWKLNWILTKPHSGIYERTSNLLHCKFLMKWSVKCKFQFYLLDHAPKTIIGNPNINNNVLRLLKLVYWAKVMPIAMLPWLDSRSQGHHEAFKDRISGASSTLPRMAAMSHIILCQGLGKKRYYVFFGSGFFLPL